MLQWLKNRNYFRWNNLQILKLATYIQRLKITILGTNWQLFRLERIAKCPYFILSMQNIKFYWFVMKIKKFLLPIWWYNRGLFPLGNKYHGVFILNGLIHWVAWLCCRWMQTWFTIKPAAHHSRRPQQPVSPATSGATTDATTTTWHATPATCCPELWGVATTSHSPKQVDLWSRKVAGSQPSQPGLKSLRFCSETCLISWVRSGRWLEPTWALRIPRFRFYKNNTQS